MIRRFLNPLSLVAAVAMAAGAAAGDATAANTEPTWTQCYSSDGSDTCEHCIGPCMGGSYICCLETTS
jgi:hypothetical protein